ncbi:MAG: hypothetical protein V1649_03700 [Patescibacteria group bacterium]
MEITKELRIWEVKAARVSNTPFQIVLEGNRFRREEESSLMLDLNTCARYNIPMSLDLVGRTLVCSFENRELPLKNNGHFKGYVDMESLKNDNLMIHSLKRSEIVSPSFGMIPPAKHSEVSRTLTLSSFGGGDGIHLSPLPCPFYRFVLELSDEEYEECKVLPPTSVFKASFRLA